MRNLIQKVRFMLPTLLLFGFGAAAVLAPPVASADSSSVYFTCSDNSTEVTLSTNKTNHTASVKCKSGATIKNLAAGGTAVVVTCPSGQSVGDSVSAKTVSFYCETPNGRNSSGDPIFKRTTSNPTIVQNDSNAPSSVGCSDTSCADPAVSSGNCTTTSRCDLISKYINPFINFLAAFVGVVVVISIIIGGIQYGSSAGDPQKVSAAKNRIRNAIIALIAFLFLYAMLNFLIPGGLV